VRTTLNLASRPVRNERLPAVLFGIAAFALLLVTVQHAVIAYRLLPGRSKALREEVAALRKEIQDLDNEAGSLARVQATKQQQFEWAILKELVDQRTFEWSQLFAVLEATLPNDVRILSVAPRVRQGEYTVDLTVRVQGRGAGYSFLRELEKRPEFSDVSARNISSDRENEEEFVISMQYQFAPDSDAVPAPPAPAAPAASAAGHVAQNGAAEGVKP
jgi:Tfp pilus assembly protein PilN